MLKQLEHALAPLADLPVLEVVSASHIITDLTLNAAQPAGPVQAPLTSIFVICVRTKSQTLKSPL
jgi:acetoacetate decarboxylase